LLGVSLLLWGHGTARKLLALHRRTLCALIQGLSVAGDKAYLPRPARWLVVLGGVSERGGSGLNPKGDDVET
jgi:hypothetical protein